MARATRLAAVALLCLSTACPGKKQQTKVVVEAPSPEGADTKPGPVTEPKPVTLIRMRTSIDTPKIVLDTLDHISEPWRKEKKADSVTQSLQNMLTQTGFGAGFYQGVDWARPIVTDVAYPVPDQNGMNEDDLRVATTLPTANAKQAVEGLPAGFSPQPLGDDTWQMMVEGLEVFLRINGGQKSLDIGHTRPDLDQAASLMEGFKPGHRIRFRAWDLPSDELDPSGPLGLPVDAIPALGEVLRRTESVEFSLDLGPQRPLLLRAGAEAPLSMLGIEPLGDRLTGPAKHARALSSAPVWALEMAWGDPTRLHQMLDKFTPSADNVPPPLDKAVKPAAGAAHGILDQVKDRVSAGVYLDSKDRGAFILSAPVKSDAEAQKALRALWSTVNTTLERYLETAPADKQFRFRVNYKPDGLVFSGVKADHFTVTVPPVVADEISDYDALFFGTKKPKLEVIVVVHDGVAMMALGAGSRSLSAEFVRGLKGKGKASPTEKSMNFARTIDQGCQICVAADPKELVRLLLLMEADSGSIRGKELKAKKKQLAAIKPIGDFAVSIQAEDNAGAVTLGASKEAVIDNIDRVKQLFDLAEAIDELESPKKD